MNIDELEQLAKLATPGPWQSGSDWIETTGDDAFDGDLLIRVAMNSRACSGDLQYIAAANPETILAMIAELRELAHQTDCTTLAGILDVARLEAALQGSAAKQTARAVRAS